MRRGEGVFEPESPAWAYDPDKDNRFFASFISGAHRLANGNTLVCSGPDGRVLEVTADGEVVWEYKNPFALVEGANPPNDNNFSMFRASRIPPDHPALEGKALAPIDPQPKTAHQLFAERQPPEESPTGWQSLTSLENGMPPWATVLGAEGRTLQLRPDPDNDDRAILIATGESTSFARSHRPYENFILELEWKLTEKGGDAGVLVWADPLPAVGAATPRGVEIDIFGGEATGESSPQGAVFANEGARITPRPAIPRRRRAVDPQGGPSPCATGGAVEPLPGNGSRWHSHTRSKRPLSRRRAGVSTVSRYLGLVSNSGEVQIRNARIWDLPAGAHAAGEADAAHPASSHRPLYNGVDLEGWKVVRGDWEAGDWRMTCGAGSSAIEITLPDGAKGLQFDFKRANGPGDGGTLPLEIGGARFDAAGEIVGQWNRVVVSLADSEVAVEFGKTRQTIEQSSDESVRLALFNDGAAAEFANVFVVPD